MSMANGTATQDAKMKFKPRKTATEVKPDAPEGEWEVVIPKGKCKKVVSQNEDPGVRVAFQLKVAADEKNETFQGTILYQGIYFYDEADGEKRRAANMSLGFAKGLCEATGVDFDEVYPKAVNTLDDLDPFVEALEGQKLTIWTVHRPGKSASGEPILNIDIRFKKPGSSLVTKGNDDEEEEENEDRPGKKPAKKSSKK